MSNNIQLHKNDLPDDTKNAPPDDQINGPPTIQKMTLR